MEKGEHQVECSENPEEEDVSWDGELLGSWLAEESRAFVTPHWPPALWSPPVLHADTRGCGAPKAGPGSSLKEEQGFFLGLGI